MCFWKDGTKTVERSERGRRWTKLYPQYYLYEIKEGNHWGYRQRSFKYIQHLSEDNDKNKDQVKKRQSPKLPSGRSISPAELLPLRIVCLSVEEEQFLSLWVGLQEREEKPNSLLQRIYSLILSPQIIPL